MRICVILSSDRQCWHQPPCIESYGKCSVSHVCKRDKLLWYYCLSLNSAELAVAYPSRPQSSHTCASNWSDDIISLSVIRLAAPYDMRQSRSISPDQIPFFLLDFFARMLTKPQPSITRSPGLRVRAWSIHSRHWFNPSVGWRVSLWWNQSLLCSWVSHDDCTLQIGCARGPTEAQYYIDTDMHCRVCSETHDWSTLF